MNNANDYFNIFFSLNNLLIYTLLSGVVLVLSMLMIFKKFINPIRRKYQAEKENMIKEHSKMMSVFAELDPTPLIRIDVEGNVVQANQIFRKLSSSHNFQETLDKKIIEEYGITLTDVISRDLEFNTVVKFGKQTFSINIKGNSDFKIANIHMMDITKTISYEQEIEDYKSKLHGLTAHLENKYEKEKKFLAYELHDDIGQKLVLLKLKLYQLSSEKNTKLLEEVDDIYNRVRDISRKLKPAVIVDLGLKIALQTLVARVSEDCNVQGFFGYIGEETELDPELEICIYRISQEAMNNIIKHADAQEFAVQIVNDEKSIDLIISDDGKGIPPSKLTQNGLHKTGIGMQTMKERAENFNGTFKISSIENEGTTITVSFPKIGLKHEEHSHNYS